jgi:hypothetical protein
MVPIIAGDFNLDLKRNNSDNTLTTYLKRNNMLPLLHTLVPNTPTWSARETNSQIDEIWILANRIDEFTTPQIINAAHISESDHKIIYTQWNTQDKVIHIQRKNTHKRRIYQYEKMSQEK